jgi:hypothetical protein
MQIGLPPVELSKKNGSDVDTKLSEKKRSIRALKRVLIAKAEVRRLQALTRARATGNRR